MVKNKLQRKEFYIVYGPDAACALARRGLEVWAQEEIFCPKCGQKAVWRKCNGGDFYLDEQHICTACEVSFYLPGGAQKITGNEDIRVLSALRSPDHGIEP